MAKKPDIINPVFDIFTDDVNGVTDALNQEPGTTQDSWQNPKPKQNKNNRVNFMVTAETKAQLERLAQYHGLTISAYLNELIKRDAELCKID